MPDPIQNDPTNVNQPGDNANPNVSGQEGKWFASLPEGVHEHVSGFETQEAFVNDYVDKKGKIPVVPKEAKEYTTPAKPEALKDVPDENYNAFVGAVKNFAHSAGLTQKQFEQIMTSEVTRQQNARAAQIAAAKKAIEDGTTKLKETWGNEYDANFKKADQLATALFSDEFKSFLGKTGMNNHPEFIKGMFELSKKVSEDVFITPEGSPIDTNKPGEVQRDPRTGLPMLKFNKKS